MIQVATNTPYIYMKAIIARVTAANADNASRRSLMMSDRIELVVHGIGAAFPV